MVHRLQNSCQRMQVVWGGEGPDHIDDEAVKKEGWKST